MMYPWYRDTQIGVGQYCSPVSASIKTETGYNDCMLALDYAASQGSQSKVSANMLSNILHTFSGFVCTLFKNNQKQIVYFYCAKIILIARVRSWWKFEFR